MRRIGLGAWILGLVVIAGAGGPARAASIAAWGTWTTTLEARDLDGDLGTVEAWYDTALDVSWLADASVIDAFGQGQGLTHAGALTWAAGLDVAGVTGWRLPGLTDTGATGCDYANSGTDCGYNVDPATGELAHLFYVTLGNAAEIAPDGSFQPRAQGNVNTGPFADLEALFASTASGDWYFSDSYFWLEPVNPLAPTTSAWCFGMVDGQQGTCAPLGAARNAWALHDGAVGVAVDSGSGDGGAGVPEPGVALLLLAGLAATARGVRASRCRC